MTREQLEHLIRAASTITDDDELVIIGSQSILGQFPEAPAARRAGRSRCTTSCSRSSQPGARRIWSFPRWPFATGSCGRRF